MLYKFLYKCRLCGQRFSNGETSNKEIADRALSHPCMAEDNGEIGRLSVHLCVDGGRGLADLLGYAAYDNDGRSASATSPIYADARAEDRHFAIMSKYEEIGQTGCTLNPSPDDMAHITRDGSRLVPLAREDCKVCKEFGNV